MRGMKGRERETENKQEKKRGGDIESQRKNKPLKGAVKNQSTVGHIYIKEKKERTPQRRGVVIGTAKG